MNCDPCAELWCGWPVHGWLIHLSLLLVYRSININWLDHSYIVYYNYCGLYVHLNYIQVAGCKYVM